MTTPKELAEAARAVMDCGGTDPFDEVSDRANVALIAALDGFDPEAWVPASLSPEWHAELGMSAAEGYAEAQERAEARLAAIRERVKGLRRPAYGDASSVGPAELNAVLTAVIAILDEPPA